MRAAREHAGWKFAVAHALDKVYSDQGPSGDSADLVVSVFLGEPASFQVAFEAPEVGRCYTLVAEVNSAAMPFVSLAVVDEVPCDLPAFADHDDGYERDQPGLFPDLLRPLHDGSVPAVGGRWTTVWVDFCVTDASQAGLHNVAITLREGGSVLHTAEAAVEVLPAALPALPIVNSTWLHADCLAQFYGVEVFSPAHWRLLDAFIAAAARMQVNSLLTPVWTPPLDTERGGHRLRTQLVEIGYDRGTYSFRFDRLDRWLELCRKHRIDNLEIAHLFTQWGAEATPSIYVTEDGELVEKFGWHVRATDPTYRAFLTQFLPALRTYLDREWNGGVFFHISDEPSGREGLASYLEARDVVVDLLDGCVVIDALSDVEFYDEGAVAHPVVATDAVEPFLARHVQDLWVYYCVAQNHYVANRFFALPSSRNRVIGHQLFLYDCAGFLHWGFNFYNSKLSRSAINPFEDTTASGAFLGGDAFIVYPGDGGEPLESIRYKVFSQAMFDLRAFAWLAELAGKESVATLIDTDGRGGRLRFDNYSADPLHYLRVRSAANAQIMKLI